MNRKRARHATAYACALAAILVACHDRWQRSVPLGALRVTEYWSANRLDWEGGNTCIERLTLCDQDGDRCRETPGLRIEPQSWELETPRWIAATWGDVVPPRYFDTQAGRELRCEACGSAEPRSALAWSLAGADAVGLFLEAPNPALVVRWLRFTPEGVAAFALDTQGAPVGIDHPPSISSDGSTAAWLSCERTCAVVSVDLASGVRERAETGCPDHAYLELGWQGAKPLAQYTWGAALGDTRATLCRDSAGEIALPFGPEPQGS